MGHDPGRASRGLQRADAAGGDAARLVEDRVRGRNVGTGRHDMGSEHSRQPGPPGRAVGPKARTARGRAAGDLRSPWQCPRVEPVVPAQLYAAALTDLKHWPIEGDREAVADRDDRAHAGRSTG